MKFSIKAGLSLSLLVLAGSSLLEGRSAVYDFVLRRSLLAVMTKPEDRRLAVALSSFGMGFEDKKLNTKREGSIWGTLVDARYYCPTWWVEGMTAPAVEVVKDLPRDHKANDKDCCCCDESDIRFALDDILFSVGHDCDLDEGQLSLYGLVGVPTQGPNPNIPLVGTGMWTIGGGFDGAYCLYQNNNCALNFLGSGRLVHSFKRRTDVRVASDVEQTTITPTNFFQRNGILKFDIGNWFDALIALQYSQNMHSFEVGYNPTVPFGQRARLKMIQENSCTSFKELSKAHVHCRHTVYGQYVVTLPLCNTCPLSLGLGLSYGFYHGAENNGVKGHAITGWLSASLNY